MICQCGCGLPAPIAKRSNQKRGWIKGQPIRYRMGHAIRAKYRRDGKLVMKKREVRVPLADRFWAKVDRRGSGECWHWIASRRANGYGQFGVPGRPMQKAHRVAWFLVNGDIPVGMCVCHRCDTPSCVNPNHLFLGTLRDNARDMVAKGRNRQPRGDNHPHRKISSADALEIKRRISRGAERLVDIAKDYGISPEAVGGIKSGRKWRHVCLPT